MKDLLNRPDVPLDAIHDRFKAELRGHLEKDLCTVLPSDSPDVVRDKNHIKSLFDEGLDFNDILKCYIQAQRTRLAYYDDSLRDDGAAALPAEHPAGLNAAIQDSKNADDRAGLYASYYCGQSWSDTPQQRNMKAKYSKVFESGLSHDTVLGMWRRDAKGIKGREVERLKHGLGELQMAQSAHLKNKARKMEKDIRVKDRVYVDVPKPEPVKCSLEGCQVQMDAKEGPIECAVCDWLVRQNPAVNRHFYYCSEEHAEEDFVSWPSPSNRNIFFRETEAEMLTTIMM